tara:strand:+ start:357 stop:593 length:237 start_codon:yes stop_codon:yes gene_type:complete
MSEKKKAPIESLGLDEALADLKFLAQRVSDMSKDLAKKAVDNAEGVTDKVGDIVESTGDALITAGETIKSTKRMFDKQ